jgi:alanyl-tRNA synthetase
MSRSASQIRREFIDSFVQRAGHTFVPSSPVVPHDDPTLLFTNAGMNQFKDVFLGTGTRPYTRAVNTQKCIRAGGKHNDLEDVGKDTYHHTFFEMLGNWSFGDYFKAEAIQWAWELLTDVWKLPKDRLHATYFQGDPAENLEPDLEARDFWLRYLPPERVHAFGKKDNFWEMGESGPCGPCSEIHIDQTRDGKSGHLVNAGDPRVIEIWNLVFIQFNRAPGTGTLSPLPAKHVDTGMGFERITRVIQGKTSNYDTDLWLPIFAAIEQISGVQGYRGTLDDHVDIAYRVIADHVRCLTFAITDGARPSNEGRGYVLRRILRRAVRHAHQTLGVKGPMLCKLVPSVVQSLGEAFPELKKNPQHVADVIREEEEGFLKTLDRGLELFGEAAARGLAHKLISAADAFKLHDTYGFPIDLTRVMAEERGMTVDEAGFEKLMDEAREKSRSGGSREAAPGSDAITLPPDALARLKAMNVQPTDDLDKYHGRPIRAKIEAIWNGSDFDEHTDESHQHDVWAIITDKTNFYAEAGGQIGDTGRIVDLDGDRSEFIVQDTRSFGGYTLHIGRLTRGEINVGETVQMMIAGDRRALIRGNHTATHLLNLALRNTLGDEVNQKGSLVADDRLRFDFSHGHAMTVEQLNAVEDQVNAAIDHPLQVHAENVPLDKAKAINGVRAVFGEKYPDPVRVVSIGAPIAQLLANPSSPDWRRFSIEFCGGTHLATTDEAKQFVIVREESLAAGVRRILALTGPAAQAADIAGADLEQRAMNAERLADDLLPREFEEIVKLSDELTISTVRRHRISQVIESLRERVKKLRKSAQSATRDAVVDQARTLAEKTNGRIIVERLDGADKDALLAAMDVVRSKNPDAATMLLSSNEIEGKVVIVAAVPKVFIDLGLKAGDWVKQAATICGGSGGGRPDMAQAGGKDPNKVPDAMQAARAFAEQRIRK